MEMTMKKDLFESVMKYAKPIFGFALNRTGQRQEAEDLAQEIMLQLMKSVAGGTAVQNMDSYVWTVARYTWVNWLGKRARVPQTIEINGMLDLFPDHNTEPLGKLIDSDMYYLLRREIAYLSEQQRRIVVMHYYNEMKQSDIAKTLGIPVGTVKWHLHDAKKELKKGMERVRKNGELSFNPIKLDNFGHHGMPGKFGGPSNYLKRSLTQNIVYAAYYKPMSVRELADELGTPPPFIEDEVKYLAEYDYMTEITPGKYQTNFILWNTTEEQGAELRKLYVECAVQIADLHFDALMDARSTIEATSLYYPDHDYNFLLWTLLPKNIEDQGKRTGIFSNDYDKVVPLRKDGGRYIASASLLNEYKRDSGGFIDQNGKTENSLKYYNICGPMTRSQGGSLYLWQLNTYWSDREGWEQLLFRDAELCHLFWKDELVDDEAHREEYAFLLSKKYLLKTEKGYKFNAIWVDSPDTAKKVNEAIPSLTKEYEPIITMLYEKGLEIVMRNKPKHIQPQIDYIRRANAAGGMFIPYILKHLVDKGKLVEPLPEQRKTITTWMGLIK